MPQMTSHCSTLLDRNAAPGLFCTTEGALFWVIGRAKSKVAIQLNTGGDYLAYSYFVLGDEAVGEGGHLGEVQLTIGYRAYDNFIGRVGIMMRCGRNTYLKVRGIYQPTERLRLVDICRQQRHLTASYTETAYFPHWGLTLVGPSHPEPMFISAIDPEWARAAS